MSPSHSQVTSFLEQHVRGESEAAARLLPLIYDDLRALAAKYLRNERSGHTLQPTELVHEGYLRLVDQNRMDWQGKTHFYAMAATQMRRILVEHARAAGTQKRGRRPTRVTFDADLAATPALSMEFLAIEEALTRLAGRHERQARVAEMRLFAGMRVKEAAFALGVSERTVKEDWRVARAWLMKELSPRKAR